MTGKYSSEKNMKIFPIILILPISLIFSSCHCSSNPSKPQSQIPQINTHGGVDNESWSEVLLTATSLPPVQINVDFGPGSWIFANVLRSSEAWILGPDPLSSSAASALASHLTIRSDGWPASLPAGYYMELNVSSYPTGTDTATGRTTYLHGVWVLTWEGTGTVEMLTSENNGEGETTLLEENGRIIKLITTQYKYPIVFVDSTDTHDPVHNMKLWSPEYDGAGLGLTPLSELSPGLVEGSLEPLPGTEEPLFHPVFIAHIREAGPGISLRMMSFLKINQEPDEWGKRELTWSDKGDSSYCFGSLSIPDSGWVRHNVEGYRQKLGVPYEWLIDMCNETDNDLWIQVPHICSENLIRNLARLVAGQNGHAGLESGLRVWFEYSNEVWNGASVYLPQFNRASAVAAEHFGVAVSQLTTEQRAWGAGYLQAWAMAIFEDEWAKCGCTDDRMINVVAGFALSPEYNRAQIESVKEINPALAETIAISNYFGAASSREIFAFCDWSQSDGVTWSDQLISQSRSSLRRNLYETYESWKANAQMAAEEGAHLISYEGGQHVIPVGLGDGSDPVFQKFMSYLSYLEAGDVMKELYREHYSLWSTAGGRTVSLFVDISGDSYWGYWGAKQLVTDTRATAGKWDAFISWTETMNGVRAQGESINTSPLLAETQIRAEAGIAFSTSISSTGGETPVAVDMIGGRLPDGVTFTAGTDGTATISGTPLESSVARIIVRALDADNDPDYRVYTISVDPAGMSTNSILCFNGDDIPATVHEDGSENGRYDPQRDYEYRGISSEMLFMPFSIADGSVLFGPEYPDSTEPGTYTISPSSQCNMYGGWCVTQLPGSGVPSCETSYTTLRDSRFMSWSGANYNGTGAPTTLDIFLVWKKDQFTSNTESSVFSFGSSAESSTIRVDFTDLITDGENELRFAVLNHESGTDTWYMSEISYNENYVGDGYLEHTGFNGSSGEGNRWSVINPSEYSFAIPDPSSLAFAAKSFSDIRALGLMYHGRRDGYHYNFGFQRFIVLGNRN